ncbi:hypothetical protein DBR36_01270 [Microbacterium sp. HMWF026]|uniref:hypothetical protein n=1 Tax=Microbacterium sp. HMWF026 TaxID=2056861 RepID=UPI000D394808|nr:hypothetical protein [Microbacterium sp. HMWF026]PTT22818.1 hypothetical protein DBR36_01270 [Microbacterium sp. HMWF026]
MSPLARVAVAGVTAAAVALVLSACVPEAETAAPSAGPVSSSAAPSQTSSATPTPTVSATPATALPASCDGVYSAAMRSTLENEISPLNDPEVTLLSSAQAPLLELLQTIPTLRCTWGGPGDRGLATNVSIVDATQAATIRDALTGSGFGCDDADGTITCRIEQRGVSLEDRPYERGETQAIMGDIWVSTSWINVNPEGYTQDILSTVGG